MPKVVKAELLDRDLKKHVAAIHIDNRLSLLERKMANVLLLNAYPDLLTKESHRIRIKDLADMLGFDSNDRDCLKKALVNLMSTVLTWNIVDGKGNEALWRARPMLMAADIERSWCIYAYHKDLREKFFNPEIYSRINISIQKKFTSGYAFALYENCLRYRKTGSTGWFALDVLRQLLGVGDNDYYADFRRLNSKVIKPSVKQVNKTSDIFLEAETKTEKRRVVAVRFAIKENPQMSLFAARPDLAPPAEVANNGGEKKDLDEEDEAVLNRMREFGLYEREVKKFLKDHDPAYINANLDIVADMQTRGVIKTTLRAAVLDALKTDYRPRKTDYEMKKEIEESKKEADRARRLAEAKRAKQLEKLHRDFEKKRLDESLNGLTEEDRSRLEGDFIQEIMRGSDPAYTTLREMFRKKGLSHAAVHGCFLKFARERLLQDATDEEFEGFLRMIDDNDVVLSS